MKEKDGQTDNPNTVCWGGNAWGLWEHDGEDLTQSGETTVFLEEVALIWALCRPHTGQVICPTHRELKIEKDTKP